MYLYGGLALNRYWYIAEKWYDIIFVFRKEWKIIIKDILMIYISYIKILLLHLIIGQKLNFQI